jgi:hypothetical protein
VFDRCKRYCLQSVSIAPLVTSRVLFGFIMAISIVRFILNGWVHDLYVKPIFHFTYFGFEWVKPLNEVGMHALFIIMLISALGIMVGFFYRISAILFFLSFTYVELIDKTTYLNHYYFVSLVSFLLIFVPANRYFSFDVIRRPSLKIDLVPNWAILIFKFQLAIVYIFAGLAKLNYDWLVEAQPLRIWLSAHSHWPLVGKLFTQTWVAYAFSWTGAVYDLFIVFLLINQRTRLFAFAVVVAFHMITWWLFPIGMFPFIMILSTLIFFSDEFHKKLISGWRKIVPWLKKSEPRPTVERTFVTKPYIAFILTIFFLIQIILPWRFLLYPGKLFWTEQGYRFSWRVMLMEKAGYVIFHVKDSNSQKYFQVMPSDYLTPQQEKMMSTQPDMILEFAHFIEKQCIVKGIKDPEVRAESYVTLNGSTSALFLDSAIDLTTIKESFSNKDWILPYKR